MFSPGPPIVTAVTQLSNGSFNVTWSISEYNYNYTVTILNLNTSAVSSFEVPENSNSYSVTGLSDNANYTVSITAVDECRMLTSDPFIVNGECN